MPKLFVALLALSLTLAQAKAANTLTPSQQTLPSQVTLSYQTTANMRLAGLPVTLHATTTTTWLRQGAHYQTHLHMDSTVSFDQDSVGQILANGTLAPTHYEEKRPFHKPDQVDINWDQHHIQFGMDPPALTPEAGSQDRLSLQFELAQLRQTQPERFKIGSTYEVHLIGTHDIDPWQFLVSSDEVQTGQGLIHAMRFSAKRLVGKVEETMDVWLGDNSPYLPVRIRFVDRNASVVDSVLQGVESH